jgi:hypothetical protein
VGDSPHAIGVRQAGQYLRELLRHDPYRGRWAQYGAQRERDVHQVAVAKVLAGYLRRHDEDDVQYGQLTRRVSRALRGEVLSRQTLSLFLRAFEVSDEHSAILWRQWQGTELARVVTGELPPLAAGAARELPSYATILLHELHYLGPDGLPLRHRTLRDIRSLVDGLASYRYSYDTSELIVARISGGTPGAPYQLAASVWAVDVALSRTLGPGEAHSLEFESTFRHSTQPAPCFRRVAHERFENVAIRVEFHPARLPRRVWWTQWHDYRQPGAAVLLREPVALDAENAVYHRLDVLARAVAGFSWEF